MRSKQISSDKTHSKVRISLTLALIFALSSSVQAGVIVYDNTTLGFDGISFTALPQGDQIRLAGKARTVTELLIGVTRQGNPGSVDLRLRMLRNDGVGGRPATLLWDSGIFDDVVLAGNHELLSFAIPYIRVPDTFTWSIQFSDSKGPRPAAVGLSLGFPPMVGAHERHWFGSEGTTPNIHVSRVTAVPEPVSLPLMCLGLAVVGYRRRQLLSLVGVPRFGRGST